MAHPVSGIVMARARVYAVSTHWIVDSEVWKSRPSVLIATFTIVVSRIVMIAPRATTAASRRNSGSKVVCSGSVVMSPPLVVRRSASRTP